MKAGRASWRGVGDGVVGQGDDVFLSAVSKSRRIS